MSKNSNYGQYQSPNITIVPIVNFCLPPTQREKISDPITSGLTFNCERISHVKNNIGGPPHYVPNCNQQNVQFVDSFAFEISTASTPDFSQNFRNSPLILQNTESFSSTMSQSTKELSKSKYKSHNNLVDLTGFNLLKRDSTRPLTKSKDLRHNINAKIEPVVKLNTSSGKERRDCSDNLTCKTDNKLKESSKNMKQIITNGEQNSEGNAKRKPKENTKDKEDKMKKYKIKDKAAKEKPSGGIKNISEERYKFKDSKQESNKSKTHLQNNNSKHYSPSTMDLRNKIIEGSKKSRDLERRYFNKYLKISKTVTNSRHLPDSKVSLSEIDLSPDSKRHYDSHLIKHKSETELKTKSWPRKKIRTESCATTKIKPDIKKKVKDERNQCLESVKFSKVQINLEGDKNFTTLDKATNQTNTDIQSIKSVVRGDGKQPSNPSHRMDVDGVQDLRSKLSRKRSRCECLIQCVESIDNGLDRESFIDLPVKQDVEAAVSKISPILASPVYEPEPKKNKNIELMKDIKYSDPESNDCDLDPPEDLSFLDDLLIDGDEIVASMYPRSKYKNFLSSNSTVTTDNKRSEYIKNIRENNNNDSDDSNAKMSPNKDMKKEITSFHKIVEISSVNKTSENDEKTKSKEDLNQYISTKTIEVKEKEETGLAKWRENYNNDFIKHKHIINNVHMETIEINSESEDEFMNLEYGSNANPKIDIDVKNMEANNITDVTDKAYEKLTREKKAMELCDDSDVNVVEVIDIAEENEKITTINVKILLRKSDCKIPQVTLKTSFETKTKQKSKPSNTTNQKPTQLQQAAEPNKASLQSMLFTNNNPGVISDVHTQLNSWDNHINDDDPQNSKDTIEASLEKMFNSSEQDDSIQEHKKTNQIHEFAKNSNENSLQKSVDAVEVSLDTGIVRDKSSLLGQFINKETDISAPQGIIKEPPATIINIEQDKEIKIDIPNEDILKIEFEQETVKQIVQGTNINSNEQNTEIKIDADRLNVADIQDISQKIEMNIASLCTSDIILKENGRSFVDTDHKHIDNTFNNIERNTSNEKSPESQNNVVKDEPLQISEETIQIQQEKDVTIKSMSDKNIEKETISFESSEAESAKMQKKDGELKKKQNTGIKSEQERKVFNKSLAPGDTRHNRREYQCSQEIRPHIISALESRMSKYLQKKYKLSSAIHHGRFSIIYKCSDTKGMTYALKVVNQKKSGKLMEGMFSLLQLNRSRQDSNVVYLMESFQVQTQWCLLTEYFPNNLAQVLHQNKRGFHIDRVQVLSRQLVDAVNMLANASIIHSDIKPSHILLNYAQDRLKLCGFDRSNYSCSMSILPSTGTPSYRAPEVILGFQEDHRIDVWSTALVLFEMATKKPLFTGFYNNWILYQQLRTCGSVDWTMVEQSRFGALYFSGTRYIRHLGRKGYEKTFLLHTLYKNDNLRKQLFESYKQYWAYSKSNWQITKETDKLETFHTLLEQMLAMDPRNRLPIQYVNSSEFMTHKFTIA